MKTKIVLLSVLIGLTTVGSDCINQGFEVAINLDQINGTYVINPGPNPSYSGSVTVDPTTLYDQNYNLTGASIYGIDVSTAGANLGNCSGTVRVNGILLLTYNGAWTAFNTPQSILTSPLITRNQAGITELINAVLQGRMITLSSSGTVTTTPVPSGCSVTVSAYVQAYGTP